MIVPEEASSRRMSLPGKEAGVFLEKT